MDDALFYRPTNQDRAELIVLMIMLAIFAQIGTVGNGLVIFVFQRVREKNTAQMFMIFLAIIDLFTCTVIIPLTMYMEYIGFATHSNFLCKLYHYLFPVKIPLSAFIMVAISIDRYFCICHPLKKAITLRRSRFIIAGFTLLAATLGVIPSLFYTVYVVIQKIDHDRIFDIIGHNLTAIVVNIKDYKEQVEIIKHQVAEVVTRRNMTVDWEVNSSLPRIDQLYNIGRCLDSHMDFPQELYRNYTHVYNAIFPSCLVVVMILYLMIYRFMCLRRSRKLKQRLKIFSFVNQDRGGSNGIKFLPIKDDENGVVTEVSAVSHSPLMTSFSNTDRNKDENAARFLRQSPVNEPAGGKHYLSPKSSDLVSREISTSCLNLEEHYQPSNDADACLSLSTSCSNFGGGGSSRQLACTPSPVASSAVIITETGNDTGKSTVRCQDQEANSKSRGYKKRDSVKRYKGKKRKLRGGQRTSDVSRETNPGRLREENRIANVKTALMLFTVNIVFAVAFGPAYLMTLGVLPFNRVVFYLYFVYNVANPFIYAFMNYNFKAKMRNIFNCTEKHVAAVTS